MNLQSLTWRLKMWGIPLLVVWLLRLFHATFRIRVVGGEHLERLTREKKAFLLGIWHENVLFSPILYRNRKLAVVVSASDDGELITRVVQRFGNTTVRGSSTRGGRKALQDLRDHIRKGGSGAVTPDGPLGPALKVKTGIVSAAQATGAVIVPAHYEANRSWLLAKTWDQTRIPKPFCRLVVRFGEPVAIPADLKPDAFEETIAAVEAALLANRAACRALVTPADGLASPAPDASSDPAR